MDIHNKEEKTPTHFLKGYNIETTKKFQTLVMFTILVNEVTLDPSLLWQQSNINWKYRSPDPTVCLCLSVFVSFLLWQISLLVPHYHV